MRVGHRERDKMKREGRKWRKRGVEREIEKGGRERIRAERKRNE